MAASRRAVVLPRPERALRSRARPAGLRRAPGPDGDVRGVRLRRDLHERAPRQALRAHAVAQPHRGGAHPADAAHQDRHPRQPARAPRPPGAAGRGDRDARLHVGRPHHLGLRPRRAPGVPGAQRAAGGGARSGSTRRGISSSRRGRRTSPSSGAASTSATTASRSGRARCSSRIRPSCCPPTATKGSRRRPAGGCRPASPIGRSRGRKVIFDRYRAAAARHGWTPTPEHCLVLRHVYVAETNARAREEAEPHLDYFWQKLLSYHRGSMKLLGQSPPARPAIVRSAEDAAALRVRLRPDAEGRAHVRRRPRLRRRARSARTCRSWAPA